MILDTKKRIQNKKARKSLIHPRSIGIVLFVLSLVILVDNTYRDESSSSWLSRLIIQPVSFVQQSKAQVASSFSQFTSYFQNMDMIEDLKAELETARLENIRLKQQMSEFDSYREAMRFPHDPEFPGVVAIVKLRDYRLTESIIIDRGSKDGITINRPVYCPEGLVGRTLKITPHFSKVQPITDPASVVPVYVEGTLFEGILRGSSENSMMVLSDDHHMSGSGDETATPQPGMRILTSGSGKVFPRDLVVGIVESTGAEEGVLCRPTADIQSVRSVIVLKTTELQEEMLSLLVDTE